MTQQQYDNSNDDSDVATCLLDLPESLATLPEDIKTALSELWLQSITSGLTEDETDRLNQLMQDNRIDPDHPELADMIESYELAAAEAELASLDEADYQPMPADLMKKVMDQANGYDFSVHHEDEDHDIEKSLTDRGQLKLAGSEKDSAHPQHVREQIVSMSTMSTSPTNQSVSGRLPQGQAASKSQAAIISQWGWVSAAAIFIVAFAGWMSYFSSQNKLGDANKQLASLETIKTSAKALQQQNDLKDREIALWKNKHFAVSEKLTASQRREQLLAQANDVMQSEWAGLVESYKQVKGDIVWSTGRQEGYMRLTGLPMNDPSQRQYQLWIVDPSKGEKFNRIDGGVFNVNESGEVIIPVDPKIQAGSPVVFAITSEKPGGVVVSAGPLLAVAEVK